MGTLKRSMMAGAAIGVAGVIAAGAAGAVGAVGAAGASVPALAATTSGVRYAVLQGVTILGSNSTECSADLLSAAASDGNPAYASAVVTNTLTQACTGWLESSVNGGAWTNVSPLKEVPGGQGIDNPAWYKTANYYAAPGTSVRACIEVKVPAGSTPACSKPASLAQSTAKSAPGTIAVSYAQRQLTANIGTGSNQCSVYPSSSTASKSSTTKVNLTLWEQGAVLACTAWLESSSNGGQTWKQATATYSSTNTSWQQYAFSPAIADGTGELARACVQDSTAMECTQAW
jgi:hypothetical protein